MEVKACKECGRLFNHLGGIPLCPNCKQILEDKFQQVKEYIYEHREADIQKVSEDNDVSVKQLRQWVKEERLQFSEESGVGLECESCGAMIRTGRFCVKCKEKFANSFGMMYQKSEPQLKKPSNTGAKMRFLDN